MIETRLDGPVLVEPTVHGDARGFFVERFHQVPAEPAIKRGKPYLLCYLGVMGPQDGVDYALRAIQLLRDKIGRDDMHCIFMGGGDEYESMVHLKDELGLADIVEFPGRGPDEFVQRCLYGLDSTDRPSLLPLLIYDYQLSRFGFCDNLTRMRGQKHVRLGSTQDADKLPLHVRM